MDKLIKKIKYFIYKIKERQKIKVILQEKKSYLCSGNYRIINKGKRIAYLKNDKTIKFIKMNHKHLNRNPANSCNLKSKVKRLITECIKVNIKNNKKNRNFIGSLMMFSRNGNLKIFDFDKGEIINFINDTNVYHSIKKAYLYFNKFFNIPTNTFNDELQFYKEKYIKFKPYSLWSPIEKDTIIHELFNNYIDYFTHCKIDNMEIFSVRILIKEFKNSIYDKKLVEKILNELDEEIYKSELVKVWQHGDMNFNNILLNNERGQIIDWEFNGNFIFFYDILNIILVEAVYQGDNTYLDKYMAGEYDYNLYKLFGVMGQKYNINIKKQYMIIFFIERMLRWEMHYNYNYLTTFINKVLGIISYVNTLNDKELHIQAAYFSLY